MGKHEQIYGEMDWLTKSRAEYLAEVINIYWAKYKVKTNARAVPLVAFRKDTGEKYVVAGCWAIMSNLTGHEQGGHFIPKGRTLTFPLPSD